jgi:hypothetical protein
MRPWLVFLPIASLACGSEARRSGSFDDAMLIASEELRVGSPDDPEAAFTWFRDLEVGPDGSIFTAHPQESQIRVHDASGSFVRTIGRQGEGPGEFDRVGPMAIVGDTLWVLDYGLYRFSYFDLEGNLLRTRRIPIDLGDSRTDIPPRPRGLLRDGTIIGSPPAFSDLVASGDLTENYFVRMDTLGNAADTIATYSLVNTTCEITNNETGPAYFGSYQSQPFSDAEIVRVSDYDMTAVRVTRGPPGADDPPAFTVTVWEIDGDTVFSRAFPYNPIPLRTAIVDSIIDEFAESVASSRFLAGRATFDEAARWARESLYLPEYHPPVSSLVIGADGQLWLRAEELGEPVSKWRILSADRDPVGVVELPSGFAMLYARGMQVWGSEYDELDVPYIVRYRITEQGDRAILHQLTP